MQVKGRGKCLLTQLLIFLLTVGVVCSHCSCAIKTDAKSVFNNELQFFDDSFISGAYFKDTSDCKRVIAIVTADDNANESTYTVLKGYSNYLDSTFSSTIITRCDWLKLLINKLGLAIETDLDDEYRHFVDKDYYDGSEYFITAIENGVLNPGGITFDQYSPATRQYVSATYVNAVGYTDSYTLDCDDYKNIAYKSQAAVMVYLGYFELDSNNCFNPVDGVTAEQVQMLIGELDILEVLKGKTVMSFGDSIMHGVGEDHVGIADYLAQRYMMTAIDYSLGGATFGYLEDRSQISNQILDAISANETADIILLNGGTNDMRKVKPGEISDDFEYGEHGRKYYAQGMEYAIGLLNDNYPDVPLLYIRAHNMVFSTERNEIHFGTIALNICDKWNVPVVDIYKDTEFNTAQKELRFKYTENTMGFKNGDTIHPNRLGYYKYYIPLTSEKIVDLLLDKMEG